MFWHNGNGKWVQDTAECRIKGLTQPLYTEEQLLAARKPLEEESACWKEQAELLQHQNDAAFEELQGEITRLEAELGSAQAENLRLRGVLKHPFISQIWYWN